MAKTPRTRHSTSKKEPVTIDLEAVHAESTEDDQQKAEPKTAPPPAGESDEPKVSEPSLQPEAAPDTVEPATESAASSPSEPEPIVNEASASRSRSGAVAGGVVGGVIALLLGAGLQYAGVLPSLNAPQQDGARVEALEQQLTTLRSEVTTLQSAPAAAPSLDQAQLDAALADSLSEIATMSERVQALEEQSAAGGGETEAALATLEQRRSELETSFTELSNRLSESGIADGDLPERVQSIEAEMNSLRETVQSADETGRDAASDAISAVTSQLDEVDGTVQDLSTRLDELSQQVARQDEGPKVALVVAASSLKSAVERGGPFGSELETYSSLAPNPQDFDQLRPFAEQGIPTLSSLSAEATRVASHIAERANAPDASAGIVDRLVSSARSIVRVRPVGEVAGDGPVEIAARMEAAVKRGDLAAALREFEALPPESQALATEFSRQLRARQAADQILDEALSTALKPA